jgi:hypothetical protein
LLLLLSRYLTFKFLLLIPNQLFVDLQTKWTSKI